MSALEALAATDIMQQMLPKDKQNRSEGGDETQEEN